jgi:hypothetical protein
VKRTTELNPGNYSVGPFTDSFTLSDTFPSDKSLGYFHSSVYAHRKLRLFGKALTDGSATVSVAKCLKQTSPAFAAG